MRGVTVTKDNIASEPLDAFFKGLVLKINSIKPKFDFFVPLASSGQFPQSPRFEARLKLIFHPRRWLGHDESTEREHGRNCALAGRLHRHTAVPAR
jgi:hypothetical protein